MPEDPQDPQIPEMPGESMPGPEPAQPGEQWLRGELSLQDDLAALEDPLAEAPIIGEAPRAGEAEDYVSELRRSLAIEESSQPKRRSTGELFRRITGSLKRVTGSLRNTGELREDTGQLPPEMPSTEIADDFLADRLGGATAVEPGLPQFKFADESEEQLVGPGLEAEELYDMEEPAAGPVQPGFDLEEEPGTRPAGELWGELEEIEGFEPQFSVGQGEAEAITPQGSSLFEALETAGEAEEEESEPDWMSEIRGEAARERRGEGQAETEPEAPPAGKPARRGVSSPLRDFITGILHGGEEKRKGEAPPEIPDDMVAGRLGGLLGIQPEETAPAEPEDEPTAAPLELLPEEEPAEEIGLEQRFPSLLSGEDSFGEDETDAVVDDSTAFLLGLEARFGQFDNLEIDEELIEQYAAPQEEENPFSFLAAEETITWEEAQQAQSENPAPITAEELWQDETDLPFSQNLASQIWGQPPGMEEVEEEKPPSRPVFRSFEEAEAATYLTGEEVDFVEPEAPSQDYLLRRALDRTESTRESGYFEDIRSIALEDYDETGENWVTAERAVGTGAETTPEAEAAASAVAEGEAEARKPAGEEAVEEDNYLSEPPWNFKTWLAKHSLIEKVLLAEAALAVIAVLFAVPFFIFMIARGPAQPETAALELRSLPADLPYPVGLTLPGGWFFPLQKSHVEGSQWRPVTSEWLEGTELRRVVALPWNQQTEAVIQTFQPGDRVELNLSNNSSLVYKVEKVERVPVGDADIYQDRRPSLVIILYQEKAESRWVVICKPQ